MSPSRRVGCRTCLDAVARRDARRDGFVVAPYRHWDCTANRANDDIPNFLRSRAPRSSADQFADISDPDRTRSAGDRGPDRQRLAGVFVSVRTGRDRRSREQSATDWTEFASPSDSTEFTATDSLDRVHVTTAPRLPRSGPPGRPARAPATPSAGRGRRPSCPPDTAGRTSRRAHRACRPPASGRTGRVRT